ncbi:sugar transferase [Paludisphaera rhizosphaerae]|uniref:sugar transferase n=1 Tax=Paludisphaera rhizosphaerae TaxID=2711216 RepID=UPI002104690B|nr:sugar transferase [Paludisphaera rhizosphaerae]
MDVAVAATALFALWPLLIALAGLVRLTSPGPILFRQRRLGLGGEVFWCYKFRTMSADAEHRLRSDAELRSRFQGSFKLERDPRLTRFGRFLRKTSLDELPQLFQVLTGHMSLIGPRPIVPEELAKYGEHGEKLLTVKPGLGGYWQANRTGATTYEERVRMDLRYIDERSLLLDVWLILQTFGNAVARRGAC